jgi:hypothetical protein
LRSDAVAIFGDAMTFSLKTLRTTATPSVSMDVFSLKEKPLVTRNRDLLKSRFSRFTFAPLLRIPDVLHIERRVCASIDIICLL